MPQIDIIKSCICEGEHVVVGKKGYVRKNVSGGTARYMCNMKLARRVDPDTEERGPLSTTNTGAGLVKNA